MADLSKIKKGMPKAWFSKHHYCAIGRYSCDIVVELTLGQCRIGWCKLWCLLVIHLVFADVVIHYIRCKDKETARHIAEERKECDK